MVIVRRHFHLNRMIPMNDADTTTIGETHAPTGRSSTRATTIVVLAAVFMTNLDLWIVNVAFVAMQHDIGGSLASLSWVLNGYAVTLAALLVAAGQLGDRFGHRQVFLSGLALFTLGSVACAAAPTVGLLVAARVVQAAGAAAQLPTSLALLLATTEPARRLTAARTWSAAGALAAATGPVLGGALILASWRWVFLVNLPIGLAVYALGHRTLPATPAHRREPLPDLVGGAVLIVVVSALTDALVEAPTWGWTSPRVLVPLGLAPAGAALFAWRSRTHPVPLLEPALLRARGFASANAATFLFSVAFAIMLLSNSLWCQEVWHYSAVVTGLAMVPGPLLVPIVALASNRLVHRLGPGRVAALGGLTFALSQLWRVWMCTPVPDYLRDLLPSMLLSGVAVGLALSTLIAAGSTALPGHRSATASAVINSGRQVASALGVAIFVTVLATAGHTAVDTTAGVVIGYRTGWIISAGLALLSAGVSLLLRTGRAR